MEDIKTLLVQFKDGAESTWKYSMIITDGPFFVIKDSDKVNTAAFAIDSVKFMVFNHKGKKNA